MEKPQAIGVVVSITQRNGKEYVDHRYDILGRYLSGKRFSEATRGHWGIENNLHWQLDVTFGEDRCCLRKGHPDGNFSVLRRTALSRLKNEPTAKVGIRNKRLIAGWSDDYLAKVLFNK